MSRLKDNIHSEKSVKYRQMGTAHNTEVERVGRDHDPEHEVTTDVYFRTDRTLNLFRVRKICSK